MAESYHDVDISVLIAHARGIYGSVSHPFRPMVRARLA